MAVGAIGAHFAGALARKGYDTGAGLRANRSSGKSAFSSLTAKSCEEMKVLIPARI